MKTLTGTVTSTKMAKTATVEVSTLWRHPLYQKRLRKSKRYLVDNEQNVQTGDQVLIGETRPLSARKRWTITKVIKPNH